MANARLHFFGAAGGVTGSCMLLETDSARVLIDCGMFQGSKTEKQLNYKPFPFDPPSITALLLTHAHIDHSGLIPKLTTGGFKGPIHATPATVELCNAMLADSGAIQEMEVENLNRRNNQRNAPEVKPIYTRTDARNAMKQFREVEFKTWLDVAPGIRARWWNAGHILGSASIEVEVGQGDATERLMFSGDIGPGASAFIGDPEGPSGFDHVVMESTYGYTTRPPLDAAARQKALADEMSQARAAGGPLLIPAFAVERTQELVVDLMDLMQSNRAPPGPIYVDSPLAVEVSKAFLEHGDDGKGVNRFAQLRESGQLHFTEAPEQSKAIANLKGWHVILSASGMCDAGRVRHHLKRLLWRQQATVMLVGYQAVGTLGRLLRDGAKEVRIQGEPITVNARIRNLDVYSGHADVNGLTAWAKARAPISGNVFLTHGENESRDNLQAALKAAGIAGGAIIAPILDQTFTLTPGAVGASIAVQAPRIPPHAPARLDWSNKRAQFLSDLEANLRSAKNDDARERLLASLSKQLTTAS